MTKFEFVLKSLYDKVLKPSDITDIYYDECSEDVETKRRYYISKNKEKTEKELRTQIHAELVSIFSQPKYKNFFTKSVDGYTLSEDGKRYYIDRYLSNELEDETEYVEVVISSEEIKEEFDKVGIVYLLKSKSFDRVYKVGKTTNLESRIESLKRDNRYGVFDLQPIMYISCQDYSIIESALHKFFEDFRLCRKNDIQVDTELFKEIDTIEEEFKLYAEFLMKNPRFDNVVLHII